MIHRLVLFVAFALIAVGCVSKPTMTLHHAELQGVSPAGIAMNVVLAVANDNVFDVQVRTVDVDVTVARQAAGRFNLVPNLWLPAGKTTLLGVPVVLPWSLLPAILSESLSAGVVKYHVRGYADVTATRALEIEKDGYQINEEGELPRSLFLSLGGQGISIGVGESPAE
jgi:LEA14-like dessication related protein